MCLNIGRLKFYFSTCMKPNVVDIKKFRMSARSEAELPAWAQFKSIQGLEPQKVEFNFF